MDRAGEAAAEGGDGAGQAPAAPSNVVDLPARRSERARTGPSDEDLMRAYVSGDVASFERLYDRHEAAVYRFLLRSVGSVPLAEDLLQETWISVVRHAAGWQAQAAFRTWLFRVARTRLIDHWRAREPAIVQSLDEPAGDGEGDDGATLVDRLAGDESMEPPQRAMRREQAEAAMRAVSALPPAQREVVLLHIEGELTLAQIGQVTGAGFETAKSRLRYALDKLRAARKDWA